MNSKIWRSALMLIYFSLLADFPHILRRTVFYAFQSRDLERATGFFHGKWIFFGPELTGGGNLPGPFYYLLLLPSLLIEATWESAWVEMVLLAALSSTILWHYLRSKGYPLAGLLASSFLALAPFTQRFLSLFINPSYQFIVVIPLLICICESFDPANSAAKRGRFLIVTGLLLGLAAQIHYSVLCLLPAILLLRPRPALRYWIGASLLGLSTALPYVLWGSNKELPGHATDALPTLSFLIRNFSWPSALLHLAAGLPPAIFIAAFLKRPDSHLTKTLAVCAVFGALPFAYVFFVPIGQRYGFVMLVSLSVLTSIWIEEVLRTNERMLAKLAVASALALLFLAWYLGGDVLHPITAAAIALVGCLVFSMETEKVRISAFATIIFCVLLAASQREIYRSGALRIPDNNLTAYESWRSAFTSIYRATGWSLEKLKQRIYFVNGHLDADPAPVYQTIVRNSEVPPARTEVPDGFFILHTSPGGDIQEWLQSQPIQEEIREALKSGAIRLGEPDWHEIWTVPYFVDPRAQIPRHFHNWALFYDTPKKGDFSGTEFTWNDCPSAFCESKIQVRTSRLSASKLKVDVLITGASLAQNSPWIYPTFTQSWREPFVKIECGGREHRIRLANSIGYDRKYLTYQASTGYFVSNNSWLAPFRRSIEMDCEGKVGKISAGRASSTVDFIRGLRELPASEKVQEL